MKIRTVFQPDEEVEVHDADAEVMRLQGLLHTCGRDCKHPEPEAPALKSEPGPEPTDLPPGSPVAKAPAKPSPPGAAGDPTDQAPPAQKG